MRKRVNYLSLKVELLEKEMRKKFKLPATFPKGG